MIILFLGVLGPVRSGVRLSRSQFQSTEEAFPRRMGPSHEGKQRNAAESIQMLWVRQLQRRF